MAILVVGSAAFDWIRARHKKRERSLSGSALHIARAVFFLMPLSYVFAAQAPAPTQPVIVSPKHPVDSLGETLYSYRGKGEDEVPIVPGVLVHPQVLKTVKPSMTKALRMRRLTTDVAVSGVVTAKGEMIDLQTNPDADGDAAASALEAVRKYRFAPATLDGRPVATPIRIMVHFDIY